jgi:hypothetical protein
MKNIFTVTIALILTVGTFAQAPEKMSYQAVVRDASNQLVQTQAVGMQISILQGGATGVPVYVETQTPSTNANGLVSLEIGTGIVVSGNFTTIDWANNTYFIKIETDPTGGTNYTITGTNQLMSVPYALHAKTAESITNTDKFYLGQDTLGGIVYSIYKDANGQQHGIIVNKNESTATWQSIGTTTNATRSWDGAYNTALMIFSPAATYVNGLTDGGFTDWYLPSIDELSILWHNRYHTNKALNTGGYALLLNTVDYWSSTEDWNPTKAFFFIFADGISNVSSKGSTFRVRAIRAF